MYMTNDMGATRDAESIRSTHCGPSSEQVVGLIFYRSGLKLGALGLAIGLPANQLLIFSTLGAACSPLWFA